MSLDDKLDTVITNLGDLKQNHKDLHTKVDKIAQNGARLDERTKNHEKRMDRNDRRSAGLGAMTGLAGGGLVAFLKSLWPGG